MKYSFVIPILAIGVLGLSLVPNVVHAQQSGGSDPTSFTDGLNQVKQVASENKLNQGQSSKQILQNIVAWLTSLLGTVALISLLYGGYLYISSQGDEGNVEKAKSILLYSIIGLILVGLAGVIVNVVISIATQ